MTSSSPPLRSQSSTIYALASAPGRAGVAVIRISGEKAGAALLALGVKSLPKPRQAHYAGLYDPASGELIDRGIVLYFQAPDSFTGEDVAEIHSHGGRATIEAFYAALAGMGGLRLAEPGAFSKRAFMNGKLDLTEAEAIADLVNAETSAQRRQALRQMDGALGRLYDDWRARLIRILAMTEADLDFPDEGLPENIAAAEAQKIRDLSDEIARHLDDNRRGERLRDGYFIAIIGAPNTGKSSLLNALAAREAAIVSPIAGTTRDVIEVALDLGGYPVTIADTAGLRSSDDPIEQEGIRRALERADKADLTLVLFDATEANAAPESLNAITADSLVVLNKIDLAPGRLAGAIIKGQKPIAISATCGSNLDLLTQAILARLAALAPGEAPALTRSRHREALTLCLTALKRSLNASGIDLIAEDLRHAAQALGSITGKIDIEDVLDVVFREFCIGK